MNILLIIPSFYPATIYGGPIFSTLHACQSLSDLDEIVVRVSTTNANAKFRLNVPTNQWQRFNDRFYVKYYNETFVGKFSLQFYLNIWKDIRRADIVHIQAIFNTPTPISLLFARLFNKPTLVSPRGSFCEWGLNSRRSVFKRIWIKLLIKPFNSFVSWHATCEQEKNDILKIFPKAKIFVIPNGIDVQSYLKANFLNHQDYLKKFTNLVLSPSKIIVSMGRLHKKKGFDILIDAFLIVIEQYRDAILLIAGKDVGEKDKLDQQIKKNKLESKVFFVGEVLGQDKVDFLANADLFASPSHDENFGNVYIESLASGTPIVASLNTPWQSVENENCGKWVANSVNDTSRAMLELLDKDRLEMRTNSQAFVKRFDWSFIAKQFKAVFTEIRL